MKNTKHAILGLMALGLSTLPAGAWAQDAEAGDKDKDSNKQEAELSPVANEVSLGSDRVGRAGEWRARRFAAERCADLVPLQ